VSQGCVLTLAGGGRPRHRTGRCHRSCAASCSMSLPSSCSGRWWRVPAATPPAGPWAKKNPWSPAAPRVRRALVLPCVHVPALAHGSTCAWEPTSRRSRHGVQGVSEPVACRLSRDHARRLAPGCARPLTSTYNTYVHMYMYKWRRTVAGAPRVGGPRVAPQEVGA
jgi:hypothetical protein